MLIFSTCVFEKCVPLLKASQVSSSPSSSRDTLWVMLDMVVIPPLSPCRQKAHMAFQWDWGGDRDRQTVLVFGTLSLWKKRNLREKQPTMVCVGEYRWQISRCNN